MGLTAKQSGVLKGMMAGAAVTLVVIIGALLAGPILLSPEASVGRRIAFALKTDAWIALWLCISIGLLARHRFFTPEDIDGGGLDAYCTDTAHILQATIAKHTGANCPGCAGPCNVGDGDAGVQAVGDTGRDSSLRVWTRAIRMALSWRSTITGARVCADVLPDRPHAHHHRRAGDKRLASIEPASSRLAADQQRTVIG